MALKLKPLPFAENALEPVMSAETVRTHHGKHHAKYVATVNELIAGTKYETMSLDGIVLAAKTDSETTLFNNAAQVWNHDFFWSSLSPKVSAPSRDLARAVETSFGSVDKFNSSFVEKGLGHFGSGWVWLVAEAGALTIEDTHDADNPLASGRSTLLTCDVWEHAYYLDTRNDRGAFLKAFTSKLANWENASMLFEKASAERR
jgi:Fe-Mn family superoxide dismutase